MRRDRTAGANLTRVVTPVPVIPYPSGVRRFMFLVAVLAVVACGCGLENPGGPNIPEPTTTTTATTSPLPLRSFTLGETAPFSVTYGPAGDALEGNVDITIHRIYDPSNLVGNVVDYRREDIRQPPPTGTRNVAVDVTIKNTGSVGLGEGGAPEELTLSWGLNPSSPTFDGSYIGVGLPLANCHGRAQPPGRARNTSRPVHNGLHSVYRYPRQCSDHSGDRMDRVRGR